MKPRRNLFLGSLVVITAVGAASSAFGATVYWDGVTGNWSDVANWSTVSGATTPNPGAVPTGGDTTIFNITTVDGNETVYLNGNQGSGSRIALQFDNTGTTQLLGGTSAAAADNILYTTNITVNAGAGAVTIGDTTGSREVNIQTGTNTFTNNSDNLFTIANGIRSVGTGSTTTLTFTGTGNTSILGQVNNGTSTNKVALSKTGAGILTLAGSNIYTGGSSVTVGTLTFLNTGAKATTGTHAFSAGTTLGLGVATSGSFFTDTDVTNAFAGTMTGNLAGITVTTTTNVGIDTSAGNFDRGAIATTAKGLAKLGANTLTLTGTNLYTGVTTVSGGTLKVNATGVINNANTAGGTGTINGDATLLIDGGTVKFNTAAGSDTGLRVGSTSAGNVVVTNNGTLAISTGRLILGDTAAGPGISTFMQDSGTTTVASNLYTANFHASDINISGGDFTVSGSTVLSQRANTNFNISGTANVTFGAQVTLGGQTGTYDAIINLNGGTLSVVNIANATNGNTTFNFNGGTLKANGSNSAFLVADNAYIKNGGGTIDTQAHDITIGQALLRFSGATTDALTKIGSGALTLSGASTYGGGTNIQNGSIIIGAGNDRLLTTGSVLLGAASTTGKLVLGDGTARNQTLAGLTSTGLGGSVVGGAATNSTLTLNIAGTSAFSGTLGGGGTNENNLAISKSGAGKLTLSGTNTFSGNVTLGTSSGTLRITNSSALGAGTKTVINNSSSAGSPGASNLLELDSNGGANISLADTISFQTSGSNGVILNTAGNNTINGDISMTVGNGNTKIISDGGTLKLAGDISAGVVDRVLDLAGSSLGNNEFSGVLSNGSTPSLQKSGAGKWILSGANTFRGTTTITGGTLALTNNLALQTSTLNTDFTGGGALDLTGVNTPTIGALSGAGNLAMPTNLTSLTLNPQSGSASYSGNISGGTGMKLIKSGASGTTQTLSGTNSYTGATEIEVGALNIASNTSLNGTSGVAITSTVATGGILELANGVTITGKTLTISGYGSTTVRGSLRSASNATAEWAGPVLIGGVSSPADTRVGAMPNSTLTISGKISDGTLNTFMVSADATNGKVIVSGANDYTGQTQIFRGTLALGADNSLPVDSVLNVHSAAGIADTATFDLNNNNQQVGGLLRGNTAGPAIVTNSGGTIKTLTISNSSNYSFDSAITGNLALIKSGAGNQTLSGTNTYTGTTTVSGGMLTVSGAGSLAAGSAVTVEDLATLSVAGIINGALTVDDGGTLTGNGGTFNSSVTINGIHSPGASPGIQTFTSGLTYNSTAVLNAEFVGDTLGLRGTDFDGVDVTGGDLSIDSLATLNLLTSGIDYTLAAWEISRNFTVIDYTGAGTSTGFFNLNTSGAGSFASEGIWSLSNNGGDVVLSWAPIPEPRAALLGGLGMLMLLRHRRRTVGVR